MEQGVMLSIQQHRRGLIVVSGTTGLPTGRKFFRFTANTDTTQRVAGRDASGKAVEFSLDLMENGVSGWVKEYRTEGGTVPRRLEARLLKMHWKFTAEREGDRPSDLFR